MDIKSLNNLTSNGKVYDLYTQVIVNNNTYGVYPFVCEAKHNMRIDLVCKDMYGNLDNVDLITGINSLYNPLVVQQGDILFFVDENDVDNVRSDTGALNAIMAAVTAANVGKATKNDPNRLADTAGRSQTEKNKTFIPPNIIQTSTTNVEFGEGTIILKPNF